MKSRTLAVPLILFALAVPARLAYAQVLPPAVVDANASDASKRADDLTHRGTELGLHDRWAEAEPLFREAWRLKRSYDIAGNLGLAEAALGKSRDAAEHMTFALRSFPANGKAEHRQLLEITLAKTRLKVGAVTITVSVPKADVLVDGLSIGTSPLTDVVFLDPGSRLIEAKLDGYEPAARRLDLKAGSAAEVAFELTPSGTSTKGPYIPILVVGASVTGAALIAGTVLAVLAHGKASDAASNTATLTHPGVTSPCAQQASVCAAINSDLSTRDQLSDASMGLFIGAGVVGLATLGYGLLGRRSRPATGLRFLPAIGAKQAGAVLTGAW